MAGFEVTPYGRFCLTPEVKLCRKRGGDLEQIKIPAGPRVDSDHQAVFRCGAGLHLRLNDNLGLEK
jgi:hypothetical protein